MTIKGLTTSDAFAPPSAEEHATALARFRQRALELIAEKAAAAAMESNPARRKEALAAIASTARAGARFPAAEHLRPFVQALRDERARAARDRMAEPPETPPAPELTPRPRFMRPGL